MAQYVQFCDTWSVNLNAAVPERSRWELVLTTKPNLIFPNVVWLLAGLAALVAAALRGVGLETLWPIALVGAVPAVVGLLLSPLLHREWAQIVTIFAWVGLALLACVSLGFVPMALLFIAAPAVAMLFVREKVLEAVVIAALIAGVTYFAAREGYLPEPPLQDSVAGAWAVRALLAALLALVLSTMFSGSVRRNAATPQPGAEAVGTRWRDGVEGGLFEYGANGDLVGANEQGVAQFGGSAPTRIEEFLPATNVDRRVFETQLAAARKNKSPERIRLAHAGSGEIANYDIRLTPLRTGGTLVHTHDRTDDEGELESLRRSHTSATRDSSDKTLFFAGVSHELRTPLNAIIGFSDMMRSRLFGPLPGKYAEYADLIHDSGQHMLDLIGDVLDLSKVEAGKYELNYDTFDAADVIRSSVKMIRPAADAAEVVIDINLDTDAPLLIQADRRAVRQILLNLLSNAVKFSPKGGHVDIDAQAIDGDLELSVSDNGPGMDADEIARIGEPYAQGRSAQMTADRGTGLGLSLVKSLTELHQGRMKIKSQPHEGTRVQIILPLQDP